MGTCAWRLSCGCPRGKRMSALMGNSCQGHMVLCRDVELHLPSKSSYFGLNCVPQTRYFEIPTPEPMKVTLSANINSFLFHLIPIFLKLILLPCHPLMAAFSSSLTSSSNSPVPILSSHLFSWLIFLFHILKSWSSSVPFSPLCFLLGCSPCLLPHWLFLASCIHLQLSLSNRFQLSNTHFLNQLHSWLFCELFCNSLHQKASKFSSKSPPFVSIPEPLKLSSAWYVSNWYLLFVYPSTRSW